MATISSLPVELLNQIVSYLEKDDLSALRQCCWALRNSAVPQIFRKLKVDFRNTPSQCFSLHDPNSISYIAAALHTRHLSITFPNGNQRIEETCRLLSALRGLRSVELKFELRVLLDQDASKFSEISAVLGTLSELREVRVSLPSGAPPTRMLDLSALSQLERLALDTCLPSASSLPFFQSLQNSLVNKPRLKELSISAGQTGFAYGPHPNLAALLELPAMKALDLRRLTIDRFTISTRAAELLAAHYGNLEELVIGKSVQGNVKALWDMLSDTDTRFRRIESSGHTDVALAEYLMSYSGAERLRLTPMLPCFDLTFVEDFLAPAIHAHRATLEDLDIMAGYEQAWAFGPALVPAVAQCKKLKSLKVSVDMVNLDPLLKMMCTLPALQSVTIEPSIGSICLPAEAAEERKRAVWIFKNRLQQLVVPEHCAIEAVRIGDDDFWRLPKGRGFAPLLRKKIPLRPYGINGRSCWI